MDIAQIHFWNSLANLLLGISLNGLLIWLILRKTSKEMRLHSRILLQTVLVDFLNLAANFAVQPAITVNSNRSRIYFFNGFLATSILQSDQSRLLSQIIWYAFYNFDLYGLSSQFLYRYLTLNRNMHIQMKHYLALLLPPFLATLFTSIGTLLTSEVVVDSQQKQAAVGNSTIRLFSANEQPIFIVVNTINSDFNQIAQTMQQPIVIFFYAIILFCAFRIALFVRKNISLKTKLKDLNKQLTINLIILAALPLFLLALNMWWKAYSTFMVSNGQGELMESISLSMTIPMYWLPTINPLSSILTFRPFRLALLGIFKKGAYLSQIGQTNGIMGQQQIQQQKSQNWAQKGAQNDGQSRLFTIVNKIENCT